MRNAKYALLGVIVFFVTAAVVNADYNEWVNAKIESWQRHCTEVLGYHPNDCTAKQASIRVDYLTFTNYLSSLYP